MKKLNFFAVALFLFAGFSQAQTYQNTTATATVDGINRLGDCGANVQPGVHMSEINVPLTGSIVDPSKITFNLSLNATWLGDIVADIITPSGEAITLIRRIGTTVNINTCGDSSNFISTNPLSFNSANTKLIDAASLTDAQNVPVGNYAPTAGSAAYPAHNLVNMATFLTGKQIKGDWRLIIYDYGEGGPSNIASWQIIIGAGATLKASDVGTFGSEISLKQNPVEDYLMVDVTNDFKSLNLEIYDASGKIVKNENLLKNSKNIQIDVRNLSPGMYLLTPVKDGERKQAIKFIKK